MKGHSTLQRAGIVILATLGAIVIHEFGHFAVYRAAGIPVRISLQSVSPIQPVRGALGHWAMLAGPALSWITAVVFLVIAGKRSGFGWAAMAFTNASLRLFPCSMDLARALGNGPSFSDEGDVAMALTRSTGGRVSVILVAMALSLTLMTLASRRLPFTGKRVWKSAGVYFLSLAVGIAVVIVDELTRR
jgi:hypothetical protein